ncbi:hypothetical protein SARC_10501 [Sphaeroforma arctica JP610]|uniref:Uncharacterized protein n=1 Tax=Sphaeroforma arctica JP610 TaxID=667725 RepID=A0A0L0FKN0_9EUKA|nr:hypothetical protein SARC_10501 [Sphaeroforma arctica JP610]KNC77026.1 hypothetical protein SARC_10501 [Sphaeroforma arctica JP610]|eukprot:XP_014150928.1 hypothetical protein SARC_10501 [Sphaeroforma arctica JP610]
MDDYGPIKLAADVGKLVFTTVDDYPTGQREVGTETRASCFGDIQVRSATAVSLVSETMIVGDHMTATEVGGQMTIVVMPK